MSCVKVCPLTVPTAPSSHRLGPITGFAIHLAAELQHGVTGQHALTDLAIIGSATGPRHSRTARAFAPARRATNSVGSGSAMAFFIDPTHAHPVGDGRLPEQSAPSMGSGGKKEHGHF